MQMIRKELTHSGVRGMKWGVWRRRSAMYEHGISPRHKGSSSKNKKEAVNNKVRTTSSNKASGRNTHYNHGRDTRGPITYKTKIAPKNQRTKSYEEEPRTIDKESIIKSGNARTVKKYSGQLTNNELNQAIQRINYNKQIDELANEQSYNKGVHAAKKVLSVAKYVDDASKTAVSLYNTYTKVSNTFNPKEKPRPIIGGGEKKKK